MENKKGFTLVELIIAMMVTTILLAAVYFMFVRVFQMNQEQNELIAAQDTVRAISQIVEGDIRRSSQYLEVSESGNLITVVQTNKEGTVLKDAEGSPLQMTYELKDDVLYRNNKRLLDRVKTFEFEIVELGEGASVRKYVDLLVVSETDKREVTHEKKIYLRDR